MLLIGGEWSRAVTQVTDWDDHGLGLSWILGEKWCVSCLRYAVF